MFSQATQRAQTGPADQKARGDDMTSEASSGTPAPSVELSGLDITFGAGTASRYCAVRDIDLSVSEGEFVAIVGPTGCGKSTLLNAAAGLLKPAAGRVAICGAPLAGLNARAGYLFQQDALMPWKTALDNVAVALEPKGVPREEARQKARVWLARVGLKAFAERYPHMLSGGQKKRVALAQVLIRDPDILLMDEPFGPLDAQTRLLMGNLLLDLWSRDRKAVMFVTHDLDEAIALSDRVVVMSAGPEARIVGDYRVPLSRPRDIADIRDEAAFHKIHRDIWATLRVEVQKAYAQGEGKELVGAQEGGQG
jgi:NitT/TauT family transport system ATP-binding protein